MKSICVFCGASRGNQSGYATAAKAMGSAIAARGMRLIYGGGNIGLMGIVADAALAAGGEVIGVIPESLRTHEIDHPGLTKLHVVANMHERKAMMADLADAFIALPGGIGTLEELFEIWTWGQLGLHNKPYGLLNTSGYFDDLLSFLDKATAAQFLRPQHRNMLITSQDSEELLNEIIAHKPTPQPQWIGREDT